MVSLGHALLMLVALAPPAAGAAGAPQVPASQVAQSTPLQRGVAALRAGDLRVAADELERAVALDPGAVEPHFWLGLTRLESGDAQGAAAELARAEALIGRFDARIAYQLGVALLRSGELEAARERFSALVERDPVAALPRLNLGWIAMQEDRGSAALELFEAVIADHPDNAAAYYYAGLVHEGNARFDAAAGAYERALELDPDMLGALLALGKLETARGRTDRARQLLERAATRYPQSAAAQRQLGILALRGGELEAAIGRFGRALSLDPGDRAARYNLGLAYARAGRAEEAEGALARFDADLASAGEAERAARRAMAESRAESLLRGARADIEDGHVVAAIAALEEAADLDPTEVATWTLLLDAYQRVGDAEGARRAREQLRLLRGGGT